tara:strand:+ start:76 stop:723 length:648 start_codon:yes stop_codon:yes gene_type:complete
MSFQLQINKPEDNFFQKNKYSIIKNAINYELANFCYNYFHMKRSVIAHLYKINYCPENDFCGTFTKDTMAPNTYCIYADGVFETLLMKVLPLMEKETGLELIPTYTYARLYEKGAVLPKHKDRESCEVSCTMNLGGDLWPIFIEGTKVDLLPGDMLIYSGVELEHWREQFQGNECAQVFLHYNRKNGRYNKLYDGRPMLGVPNSDYNFTTTTEGK